MPLPTMDFSNDFLLWDFAEAVILADRPTVANPAQQVQIATALRSQVTDREKSPSNGAYAGFETNWFLPANLMGGLVASPGMTVTDGKGTRFTILTADYDEADKVYQCGTVDLVLANQLRDQIDIQRATVTYDSATSALRTWPADYTSSLNVYSQLPAKVQLLNQETQEVFGVLGFHGKYAVTVIRDVSILKHDRIRWYQRDGTSVFLDVLGQTNPQRIDELPVLDCELLP